MIRQLLVVLALLSIGLSGANGKPAQARNEDVPKGPVTAPPAPSRSNTQTGSQSPTGTIGSGKSAPSGGSQSGASKPAAPGR
jgi:hypothetical protein